MAAVGSSGGFQVAKRMEVKPGSAAELKDVAIAVREGAAFPTPAAVKMIPRLPGYVYFLSYLSFISDYTLTFFFGGAGALTFKILCSCISEGLWDWGNLFTVGQFFTGLSFVVSFWFSHYNVTSATFLSRTWDKSQKWKRAASDHIDAWLGVNPTHPMTRKMKLKRTAMIGGGLFICTLAWMSGSIGIWAGLEAFSSVIPGLPYTGIACSAGQMTQYFWRGIHYPYFVPMIIAQFLSQKPESAGSPPIKIQGLDLLVPRNFDQFRSTLGKSEFRAWALRTISYAALRFTRVFSAFALLFHIQKFFDEDKVSQLVTSGFLAVPMFLMHLITVGAKDALFTFTKAWNAQHIAAAAPAEGFSGRPVEKPVDTSLVDEKGIDDLFGPSSQVKDETPPAPALPEPVVVPARAPLPERIQVADGTKDLNALGKFFYYSFKFVAVYGSFMIAMPGMVIGPFSDDFSGSSVWAKLGVATLSGVAMWLAKRVADQEWSQKDMVKTSINSYPRNCTHAICCCRRSWFTSVIEQSTIPQAVVPKPRRPLPGRSDGATSTAPNPASGGALTRSEGSPWMGPSSTSVAQQPAPFVL